jgi:membrane-bound lytic murein transglycosylase D
LRSRNALPRETGNYVPAILALTIMAKNPRDYVLEDLDLDPALEFDSIELTAPTHLALIADATERSISEVKDLNPALLKSVAPAGYELRIPRGASPTVLTAFEVVPAAHRANWRLHRVTQGETLAQIAHRYSTAAASISAANQRLDPPEAGDLLAIPVGYRAQASPRASTKSSTRQRTARRATTVRRAAAAKQPTKERSTYRTASVAARHRTTAD